LVLFPSSSKCTKIKNEWIFISFIRKEMKNILKILLILSKILSYKIESIPLFFYL